MENASQDNSSRRMPWPNLEGVREKSKNNETKREYVSEKFNNEKKLKERISIKALPVEDELSEISSTKKMIELMTPNSIEEYYEVWKKTNRLEQINEKSEKKFKTEFDKWISMPENKVDFSETILSKIKDVVASAIDESPKFKWAVETFGFPIIVAKTEDAEKATLEKIGKEENSNNIALISDAFLKSVSFLPSVINSTFENEEFPDTTKSSSRSTLPKMGESLVDPTVNGQIRHEWSHHFLSEALNDSERVNRLNNLKEKDKSELFRIAEKYSSDSTMMESLNKEFSETGTTPRTITRYSHVNMFEMFAEGMTAYLHPDTTFERFVMNATLREDIESALGATSNLKPWEEVPT